MRKFKLLTSTGYPKEAKVGGIYLESDYIDEMSILALVRDYPNDWEEIFENTELPKNSINPRFVISYISNDGLIVLNNVVEALNFGEAIQSIKGDEGVRAILSCYKL